MHQISYTKDHWSFHISAQILIWQAFEYQDFLGRFTKFCFKHLKKTFATIPNVENKFWSSYETLQSTDEMKMIMNFYLCLHSFSELWNLFHRAPMRHCSRCYFRQLFISLALRKCKKDCQRPNVILVQVFFFPVKSPIGFRPLLRLADYQSTGRRKLHVSFHWQ